MVHSEVAAYDSGRPGPLLGRPAMLASHMSALSQSQLISQMGIRSGIAHSSPSPPGSKSATPSPSSSTQEEESDAHFKVCDVEGCSYKVPPQWRRGFARSWHHVPLEKTGGLVFCWKPRVSTWASGQKNGTWALGKSGCGYY